MVALSKDKSYRKPNIRKMVTGISEKITSNQTAVSRCQGLCATKMKDNVKVNAFHKYLKLRIGGKTLEVDKAGVAFMPLLIVYFRFLKLLKLAKL